jgi:CheY-like chemotaxis protein
MSLVLAIEPDRVQADLLREVHAALGLQLVVVGTKDEAIGAIEREAPDLVLVNALLSPREEVDLVAHLRSIDNLAHLQLLTIPRLARRQAQPAQKKSLFGLGKKKAAAAAPDGCDPAAFGEEITVYLARAQEVKSRPRARVPPPPVRTASPHETSPAQPTPVYEPASSFPVYEPPPPASNPAQDGPELELGTPAANFADPLIDLPAETPIPDVDSLLDRLGFTPDISASAPPPVFSAPAQPEPVDNEVLIDLEAALHGGEPATPIVDAPDPIGELAASIQISPLVADIPPASAEAEPPVTSSDSWMTESGLRLTHIEEPIAGIDEPPAVSGLQTADGGSRLADRGVPIADFEKIRAEAEAALAGELQRVHEEAAERRERELAQWQAEAEALREATIGRAREEAEAKAREALAEELARSRAESEQMRQEEIARLQAEADERLEQVTRQAREVAEGEAARAFAEELARIRTEAETTAARTLDAEVARVHAEADARLQAELERVRREAEHARRAEQAAAQAEAERIREEAAREARAIAEATAARALEAEVARVRAEAEAVRAAAEARLAEHSKAQADASQAMAEAERVREAAAREAREAAEAAAARKLEAELKRVHAEAEARLAAHNEAQIKAEKIREAAAREAHAVAEAAASRKLEAEIERERAEADARLAGELEQLRVDAERRRSAELEEMRRQVDELRSAAAEQARIAAAEAVAAEVARAAAVRGGSPAPLKPVPVVRVPAVKSKTPAPAQESAHAPHTDPTPSSSYYDLWRAEGSPSLSAADAVAWTRSLPSRFAEKRWMLPAAAAALLVVCGGIGVTVDTTAWAATARKALAALPTVVAKEEAPPAAAAAAPPTGDLLVETTPKGAQVTVDGKVRGKTPMTVTALSPGRHKVVLESNDGVVIRREVMVRAGERAVTSELMVSGWLTVFSRIPVDVVVAGRRVGASGDGQMILSPGRHKISFVNKQYNIRETRTIDIQAGSIASHTLKLPNGTLNVDAPEGAEVLVGGDRIGVAPLRGATVPLGTHELVVRHPSFGERRQTVDIRHGATVTATVAAPDPSQAGRSFDGLKVLSESAANPGVRKPRTP